MTRRNILGSVWFWIILSLLFCVTVYWRWFLTLNIYSWGDWGYSNKEYIRQLFSSPQVWQRDGLGGVDIGLSQYLTTKYFYSILAHFYPPQIFDRIIFLWPVVLVPAISVFLLVKYHTKSVLAGFVGSIAYNFNSYILILNTGHLTLSMAYALGPLFFLFYKTAIFKKSLKFSLGAGLLGFIITGYEPRGFFLVAGLLVLYLFYSLFITNQPEFVGLRSKIDSVIYGVIPFLIVGLTNIYWLLGFSQTSAAFQGIAINTQILSDLSGSLPRALLLFSPWWTGSAKMAWGQIQIVPLYFWLIPFFVLWGFWKNKSNPDTRFWTAVSLLGIFLVKSGGQPFGDIYGWLYHHVPGFNAFRDASKFNYLTCLGYAILMGDFIIWLWQMPKLLKIIKNLLTALAIFIFAYNGLSLFLGQLGQLQKARHIPTDYQILNKYLSSQPTFFRTLYLPNTSKWAYRDVDRRSVSMSELLGNEWIDLNNYKKTGLDYSAIENFTGILDRPYSQELLSDLAIKYIVIPPEDKANDEEFIYPGGTTRLEFVKILDSLNYIKKLNIGTQDLVIYQNASVKSYIETMPTNNSSFYCSTATTCRITIHKSSVPLQLYFNESYQPGWKIHFGHFDWWGSIFDKYYFQSSSFHQKTRFGTNVYLLPALKEDTQVTLYFAPQAMVNLGFGIGFLALLATLILLCRLWLTRHH